MDAPEQYLEQAEQSLDDVQRKFLEPSNLVRTALHYFIYAAARCFIRLTFRLEVCGALDLNRPVILAPNHESSLDAPLLAAALPYRTLRHTFWVVRKGRVLANPLTRAVGQLTRAVPVDRDASALAVGAAVLRRKGNVVWFPEGTRSRDGELQEFKFGVGALARHFNLPVVPVGIDGAFEALPPGARLPRFLSKIAVRFGTPIWPEQVETAEEDAEANREVAGKLHDRVQELTHR